MQKRRRVSKDNPNKLDQLFPNRPWSNCTFSQVLQVSEPDCTHSELTKIGSNANACKVKCKICKVAIYDETTDNPEDNPLGMAHNKKLLRG